MWNLSKPYDAFRLLYEELPFRIAVYEDNISRGGLPSTDAPWYLSASFTLARETSTTTMATSTSTSTATTSTSTEGPGATDGAGSGTDDSATPTGAAVLLSPQIWNMMTILSAGTFLFSW